ncbi:DUF1178 family protein [Candidimonas humi]|jgi:hypothetical protein|uniref:DUF1178 family protein n=1 Tax=Candidimonas humi TaxID=683355 RepID=A0ABV8NZ54_9BURK|nr:DUF1178 family protein [Candidimonas humi]MBV6306480.1 DUF1178 family protein [Candidimonas humi]
MSLKVFDLQCDSGHVFEGWFGSLENYESQREGGLLSCPVCGSHKVDKKLSAPRVNTGARPEGEARAPAQGAMPVAAPGGAQMARLQAEIMRQVRQMVRNTENVGERFADEARRMHAGETEERAIRGTATPQERESLAQEGIAVMPIPDFLDDDRLQ